MKRSMAVAVLLVFAATSASEAQSSGARSRGGQNSGGRSGGGRSSGGHVSRGHSSGGGHSAVARSSGARYSAARSARSYAPRSYSSGARYSSGRTGGASYGRGHAVPLGSAGYSSRSSAQYRHPRAGYGTGYSYGHGSRYGSRSYGYRNYGYGYGYSGRYPYYGYSSYYGGHGYRPYGWGGLGLSFYYGGGYPSVGVYADPYDGGYARDEAYGGGGSYPSEEYSDRGDPRDEGAELRLIVVPDDASVWIDSEFRGTARAVGQLTLAPGRHQVEIVRPGFRSATRDLDVRPGASVSVRIELERP